MSSGITYGGYLRLRELLGAQQPLSDRHDEMLFVILHQTMELWIKQIIHEIVAAQGVIRAGDLVPAYKYLARVSRIQSLMTQAWDVLATMTAADYLSFRNLLGKSSGFQSAQFRALEYRLGLKDAAFLAHQPEGSDERAMLEGALNAPSLYDDAIAQLAAGGFTIPAAVLNRDVTQAHEPSEAVEAAWLGVYREPEKYWALYQLAEKLLDLDDALLSWRHKHALTVERIIGGKRGTGGTEGVKYLQSTMTRRCFPELWSLRTKL
ncbi:MAG TPA: tryptophan 2,3-dioxygenase [Caulobacterales bacterium]|nr:tryptophan 2,3-dioxygenase [Caulobacterales bacterium]